MTRFLGTRRVLQDPVGPTLRYIGSASNATDGTVFDMGSFTAPTDGLMIVCAGSRNTAGSLEITDVSIGGSSGTLHATNGAFSRQSAIASRVVAAGAQNVTVTVSGTVLHCIVFVWLLTNYASATPTHALAGSAGVGATSGSVTVNLPAGGIGVFMVLHADTTEETWTGGPIEQDAVTVETARATSAYAKVGPAQTIRGTATWGGSVATSTAGGAWN